MFKSNVAFARKLQKKTHKVEIIRNEKIESLCVTEAKTKTSKNCLIFKIKHHRFQKLFGNQRGVVSCHVMLKERCLD